MRTLLFIVLVITFSFAGCVSRPAPGNFVPGSKNTVCVLSKDKPFKNEVIAKITASLQEKGLGVVRDNVKNAKRYRASDYGAVIYIAEFWMGRIPRHSVRYFENNDKAPNIVFVITAGDSAVTITEPFDAVTTASVMEKTDAVAGEIMTRLNTILK